MAGARPSAAGGAAARAAAVLVVALLVAGCGSGTAPSPLATQPVDPAVDSSATAAPAATAAPPATTPAPALGTPAPAYGDTLTIGWSPELDPYGSPYALYGYRNATDAAALGSHRITLGSVVYSGLYRFDARFNAVPDLADGPCVPQGDGTVIRCRLVETTFHDGTPVTADDVTYSFRLLLRPAFSGYIWSVGGRVEARVVDQRTVDFVLATVDPTFLTEELPWIPILPRHAVEAAYAAFSAATRDLKAADLTKLADDIDEETGRDPPVCTTRLDEVDALLPRIGFPLYREDLSRTGTFDACAYMRNASGQIRTAAAALGATGIDAVADAYWCLSFSHRPIGAGPYRLVSQDADRIHLEAWPGYHGGPAATRYVDFVPARGDGTDVLDGSVDIYQVPTHATLGAAFETTASARGVRIATPPGAGYEALQFNVRPGRLFADVELRKALQLCVDLPRDVDAATGGAGTPVYGPLMPGTWAYDPSVPKPARDVAAARALIENAGWTTGADGVYAKDGIRLAGVIPVRGDAADRVKMADLVAAQARDCGMDLRAKPVSWDQIGGLLQYPHLIPGTKTPVDLYLGGWTLYPGEPDFALQNSVSAYITDAAHPDGNGGDWSGFLDAALDALVKQAKATYDQAERIRLYRQAQQEIAACHPYLFFWASNTYDVVRAAVATVDGPLDLTVPNWAWQPERLVVEKAVQ